MVVNLDGNEPWDEAIIWRGKPNLLRAFADCFLAMLFNWCLCAVVTLIIWVFLSSDSESQRLQESIELQYYLAIAGAFLVFGLFILAPRLFHEYAITRRHLYVKKWRTWTAYPLNRISEITFVRLFPIGFKFGTRLEIHISVVVPQEKENALRAWGGEYVWLEYPDDPEMVKDLLEGGLRRV